jgi:crotonobetainyl-CoA:carnitine CoA-transferase CaiB-like acyl-CoA transferase
LAVEVLGGAPIQLAARRETIPDMTGTPTRLDEKARQPWLRKLDRATAAYEKARRQLDELVADARAAGVPVTAIAEHSPYSREWARRIADQIEQQRRAKS